MNLTFLGSGCWQGIPSPFADDKISKKVKWNSKDFRFRTSLLLETKNKKKIVIEITPDIRLQSWKFKIGKPEAVLVSHCHWDHFFGLMDISWYAEKNKLKVYGNSVTNSFYKSKMSHIPVIFKEFNSYEPFVIDNIKITPISVNHINKTDGFLFENKTDNKKVAYLPDLNGLPKKTKEIIEGIDAIIIDATYLGSNLKDDSDHFNNDQLLDFLPGLKAKEIILTNIGSYHGLNHNNLAKKFSQYTISYDGMKRKY